MVPGHFAERHFAERHFAERTFCRRTLSRMDILSNGQYDERTFRRKDILPKRQLAENREILEIVTHFSKIKTDNKPQVKRILFTSRIHASLLLYFFSCSLSLYLPVFARFVRPKPKQNHSSMSKPSKRHCRNLL